MIASVMKIKLIILSSWVTHKKEGLIAYTLKVLHKYRKLVIEIGKVSRIYNLRIAQHSIE